MQKSKVSMTVVRRLPKYYQYLTDLERKGVVKISSKDLGEMMGLTASQIRQDLNAFGAYGQQGYGYKVGELRGAVRELLGLSSGYRCIIVGAGNLGRAISHYERFEGIHILAMFDNDPEKIGTMVGTIPVLSVDEMGDFVREHAIDICVLAVPRSVGQVMADLVCTMGIKAILNFVPLDLSVPEDVVVESVNITDSLFILTYLLDK